ncbi:signal peptidase I [Salinibacterium sp. NK8237]|uniref:signal peptidase I n=1 Tax=Salinibacterium sp. NK8237 TaxID=2792038 RepID=UPI0018CCF0A9|nr:signal peptidase I [Salinibacterium sp. NK8237]MBH0130277.1 signal peptidase I [Salinibacterium sp. NK8237]
MRAAKTLRTLGDGLLWIMAVIGAITGVLWIAHAFGLVQPLVVVSESMQPAIRTGDLLVALPVPVEDLVVGDIASLPSTVTGNLITHRIISISIDGDSVAFEMQGDDNDAPDAEAYVYEVGDTVLHPVLTLAGVGTVVTALASPFIGVPLFVAIAAGIVLAVLPANSSEKSRDDSCGDDDDDDDGADDTTPSESVAAASAGTAEKGTAS